MRLRSQAPIQIYFGLVEPCEEPEFGCMLAGQLVAIMSTFVTLNVFVPDELVWPLDADDPELEVFEALLDCCEP
jgi:hypothetical protein